MCGGEHACTQVHECEWKWRSDVDIKHLPPYISAFSLRQPFTQPRARQLCHAVWPVRLKAVIPTLPVLKSQSQACYVIDAEDLCSGPRACVESTLPTEMSRPFSFLTIICSLLSQAPSCPCFCFSVDLFALRYLELQPHIWGL